MTPEATKKMIQQMKEGDSKLISNKQLREILVYLQHRKIRMRLTVRTSKTGLLFVSKAEDNENH